MRHPRMSFVFGMSAVAGIALLGACGCGSLSHNEECRETVFADLDGDGFGDPETPAMGCDGEDGMVANDGDCGDGDPAIHQDAEELCDGIDNNCDGVVDEDVALQDFFRDEDGDGYGADDGAVTGCAAPDGYVPLGGDCDDADPTVYPGAEELTDGIDNDCDPINNCLPPVVDALTTTIAAYEGTGPTSELEAACVGADHEGAPVVTLLEPNEGFVAVAPFVRGTYNASQLAHESFAPELDGDLTLMCAPDLNDDVATDVLVGSPDGSFVELFYGGLPGTSATFTGPGLGLGCAVAVHLGQIVLGACEDEIVIVVRDDVEPGSDYVALDVRNLQIGGDSKDLGRSLDANSDLTKDGVDDIVVGGEKEVVVIDGASIPSDGTSWSVSLVITSEEKSFGSVVLTIPDVTADGVADLLVSAPDDGLVYIVPGGTFGEYPIEEAAVVTLEGESGAGSALAAVEAFGCDSPGFAVSSPDTDQVLVYRASDVSELSAGIYALDQSTAATVITGVPGSEFGSTLGAGDLTGDGVTELLIGAADADGGRGQVLVVSLQR